VSQGRPIAVTLLLLAAGCGGAARLANQVPAPRDSGENPEVQALNREIALAAGGHATNAPDYRIGPDDLLEVTLFDIESKEGEPRRVTARVSQTGTITLPLVGHVQIAGKSPVDAEGQLREQYKRFIHEPQITVFVKEYRSYRVSVVGYVEKPGVFEISGQRTLLEVLAMAGGLNRRAGKTVQVTRRRDDRLETLLIDLDRLSHDGDMQLNLTMVSGDVVNVPKAGIVYVQGSVKKPGAYRLRDAMTVSQALGAAGGPDDKLANKGGIRLFRRTTKGDRQEIPIDIEAINNGKSEDLQLVENDIVVVPMSLPRYVVDRFIGGIGMGLSVPVF
jgi:polysaccharide export outer membrane protein